jgi:hypothetical protein
MSESVLQQGIQLYLQKKKKDTNASNCNCKCYFDEVRKSLPTA